jgi:hypothetical protein
VAPGPRKSQKIYVRQWVARSSARESRTSADPLPVRSPMPGAVPRAHPAPRGPQPQCDNAPATGTGAGRDPNRANYSHPSASRIPQGQAAQRSGTTSRDRVTRIGRDAPAIRTPISCASLRSARPGRPWGPWGSTGSLHSKLARDNKPRGIFLQSSPPAARDTSSNCSSGVTVPLCWPNWMEMDGFAKGSVSS